MTRVMRRLTLGTLEELNFVQAEAAFKQLLAQAVKDCIDRPAVKAGRKVTMQLTVTPIASVRGNTIDCESASGVLTLRAKCPDYETDQISFGVQNDGSLIFNPDCPDNYRQQTLLEEEED